MPASVEAHAQLLPLQEPDLAELANFIATQSGRDRAPVESHLRWFLLENPARRPGDSLAFALRSGDQLVGCILLSPQQFCLEGKDILLMGSSSFYVDERHRGQGGRIFLQYCRLSRQYPLFGTSANAEAAALWKAVGGSAIPHSDCELFGVLHWPAVAEEFAHRRYRSATISRLAASPVAKMAGFLRSLQLDCPADALVPLTTPEQVEHLSIHKPSAKLTSLRNPAYIRWRYFSGHDATTAVFAFRCRQIDQDVLVTVNRRNRGYRGQIKALHLLDVYPEVPEEEWLRIAGALIARYEGEVDVLVLRNLNPELQRVFSGKGFQRRSFEAPIGWFFDKFRHLTPCASYVVPADGDGLI
jgi:hypothetical protein